MMKLLRFFRCDTLMRRFLLLYLAAFGAIGAALGAVIIFWLMPQFERFEAQGSAHRSEIVRQALQAEMDQLGETARSFGVWDETYAFVRGAGANFTSANFNTTALREFELSGVIILDRDNRVLFQDATLPAEQKQTMLLSVAGAVAAAPQFLSRGEARVRTAIIAVPEHAVLVSAANIARSDGSGVASGQLIFIRMIDAEMMQRLEQRTNSSLRLDVTPFTTTSDDAARSTARVEVHDAYERAAVVISIDGAGDIAALERNTFGLVVALFLALLVVTVFVAARSLIKSVIYPVRKLAVDVARGASAEFEAASLTAPREIIELRSAFQDAFWKARMEGELQRSAMRDAERARADAEQANNAKSQFVARMSHEMRTPLNAIIGYAELLQEEWGAPRDHADAVHDIQKILNAATRLLSFTEDVLNLARLEANEASLELSQVDVASVAHRAVCMVQTQMRAHNNALDVELDAELGRVTTDEDILLQCLVRLLDNAGKFTSGGRVVLKATSGRRKDESCLILSVSDTGPGLSEEQLGRVFDPFCQAEDDTHLHHGGAGLGLTLTREHVRALGGELFVESEIGAGSTFRIVLPQSRLRLRAA